MMAGYIGCSITMRYTVWKMGKREYIIVGVILGVSLLQVLTSGTFATITAADDDSRQAVAFLVLAPYADVGHADPDWRGGAAVIPAVRLAVGRINNRTDVLPGYRIELVEGDSGCEVLSKTAFSFVSRIFHNPAEVANVVGVIGPGCSEAALLLGTLGDRDSVSLIQISPSATSPQLTDVKKYHNTFRTLSSAIQHIDIVTKLIELNEWENVALLHDATRVYLRSTFEYFLNSYPSKIGFFSEVDTFNYPLGSIEARFKVIVLLTASHLAREIVCLAYHYQPQLIYPVYQWIMMEKTRDQFLTSVIFMYRGNLYNCSQQMMERAIEGAILTSYRIVNHDNNRTSTDVDLVFSEYEELYSNYLNRHLNELTEVQKLYEKDAEEYALSYYDATWAMALGLNASLEQLLEEASISLANYTHGHPKATAIIRSHLIQLEFEGLLGRIKFRNKTQDASTTIDMYQSIGNRNNRIGYYNGNELIVSSDGSRFVSDVFIQRVISVHPAATIAVVSIAVLLTIYALTLHIIFILFREQKSIKATGFKMSHFMFSGCYLILIQAFVIAFEYAGWQTNSVTESRRRNIAFGIFCNANEWLNSIGISLVMGTLCGLRWRLYRIFNHFHTKHFLLSDTTLTCFILSLVCIDVLVLVSWTTRDPLLATFEQQGIEYTGKDEPIILVRASCNCEYLPVRLPLVLSIKLVVLVGVVFLSSLNRRVTRKYFRNSKSVNLMVYLIVLLFSLCIGLAIILEPLNIHYVYSLTEFSLLSVVLLVCVFVFTLPAVSAIRTYFRKFFHY